MTYPKNALLQIKWSLSYIKLIMLVCIPFNAALAVDIYSTDFESGSFTSQNGFTWTSSVQTTISADQAKSGTYSLKFTFIGGADGTDAFSEQRFSLGGFYPELWISYDLYIPNNYYHRDSTGSDNNKGLMKLWGGTYAPDTREGPLLGPSFWLNGGGTSNSIVYAASRINGLDNVNNHHWDGPGNTYHDPGSTSQAIKNNDKGHWMNIVIHAKYATIANNDGIFEAWKTDWQGNTVKLHDITNGAWYGTKPNSTEPARGFDSGYLLGWANSGFDNDTFLYIDNITFSADSLNIGVSGPTPKPPTPVIN